MDGSCLITGSSSVSERFTVTLGYAHASAHPEAPLVVATEGSVPSLIYSAGFSQGPAACLPIVGCSGTKQAQPVHLPGWFRCSVG